MRVDGSAIREIERSVCRSVGLGFSRIENRENTKMKSCICFQERDESEERFSTVTIQSLLWAIYYLTLFRLS